MKEIIQINHDAITLREKFGEDPGSPVDIFALLGAQSDLTVVFYPMRESISGMCIRDEQVKLIAINSKSSKGRQRFTAAHELCHLFYHNDFQTIVCAKDSFGSNKKSEKEADRFASYFLAPYGALLSFIEINLHKKNMSLTVDDIVRIEQHFGLSRMAVLVRLQSEGLLSDKEASEMKVNIIRSAQRLGYSNELYLPNSESRQYLTIGSYVKIADVLLKSEIISTGKYEELLMDAFRDDIVYGTDAAEEQYD